MTSPRSQVCEAPHAVVLASIDTLASDLGEQLSHLVVDVDENCPSLAPAMDALAAACRALAEQVAREQGWPSAEARTDAALEDLFRSGPTT